VQKLVSARASSERGMVLISAMLLLLVMTILGAAMFRVFNLQERTAGNTREKQRALHAAETAQTYAESWLAGSAGANATTGMACNAATNVPIVCSNIMGSPAVLPWKAQVNYTPPMLTVEAAGVANGYYATPNFYISFLAAAYDPTTGTATNIYQVDAQGYGGTANAAAVVESKYAVSLTYSTQKNDSKFVNLSGP
jgi:type IV pilus assembly protein PilX